MDSLGFEFWQGPKICLFPKMSRPVLGPTGLLLGGYWIYFLGIKMLGHDVNHPPPPRVEVGGYLHDVDRDDFTCHS